MKKQLTIFLLFGMFKFIGQTSDQTKGNKILTDNHYGLFHQTIQDTIKKTISTFGHYISFGYGSVGNFGMHGHDNELLSYSLAYKSHIASLTFGVNNGYGDKNNYLSYAANYFGLLIGESLRFKYLMLSLSAGVAYSDVLIAQSYDIRIAPFTRHYGISVPIELKLFVLAKNNIGIGIHISESIRPSSQYSASYIGLSIVAGHWNSQKNKKKPSRQL